MALNDSDLKSKLVSAMNGIDDPNQAYVEFAKTVGKYIQDNAVVKFSWAGATLPPPTPTPDPQTSYEAGSIVGATMIPQPANFEAFAIGMDTMILGFQIMPASGFLLPPTTFLGSLGLTQSAMGKVDTFDGAMEKISSLIVDGVKKMINPAPLSGVHPPYVSGSGIAIMISIA